MFKRFPIRCHVLKATALALMVSLTGCQDTDVNQNDANQNDADDSSAFKNSGDNVSTEADTSSDDREPAHVCPVPIELRTHDVLNIAADGNADCFPERLPWDPSTQVSSCQLIVEYRYDQAADATASECPVDDGQQWIDDEGELVEKTETIDGETQTTWIRQCAMTPLAVPINCDEMESDGDNPNDKTAEFGWYYCENPGENNPSACTDGLDNDRDAEIDSDDPDCFGGETGDGFRNVCPYNVFFTDSAAAEAVRTGNAIVSCLKQYDFDDSKCE